VDYRTAPDSHASSTHKLTATLREHGIERLLSGKGNGPIDAFIDALNRHFGLNVRVVDYHEHAIGAGANATAVSYVEVRLNGDATSLFGVGIDSNIVTASLNAVISAVNRALHQSVDEEEEMRQVVGLDR
ncbi:MAG: hypothetical protein KDJ31_04635, partial [Candidatus Competibacteraceae bacterium]|nr:hypothetical protein [Candidatus Competibacteraceae bacterium]